MEIVDELLKFYLDRPKLKYTLHFFFFFVGFFAYLKCNLQHIVKKKFRF
jgi:hypothetical protein